MMNIYKTTIHKTKEVRKVNHILKLRGNKMNKKLILICLFIIFITNLSAIYANEFNDIDIIQTETNENNNLTLSSQNKGTFTELDNQISITNEKLILTTDYTYNETEDSSLQGITIKNSIEIDGNGHTISGNNLSKIFIINADNVVLKNINFIEGTNSKKLQGTAITWQGNNGKLINSNFTNNLGYTISTVYWEGANGEIINCNFNHNTQIQGSGAVMWYGKCGKISNSNFTDNYAYMIYASSIEWFADYGIITNCNFINNDRWDGSAISYSGKNGSITKCYFENNTAGAGAGINWRGTGNITQCTFINNLAKKDFGGALFLLKGSDYFLKDCVFINNSAVQKGGAVYGLNSKKSSNCLFINNKEYVELKEWETFDKVRYEYGKLTTIKPYKTIVSIDRKSSENITYYLMLSVKTINGESASGGNIDLYVNNVKYSANVKNGCTIKVTLPSEIGKEYTCHVVYSGYKDIDNKITYLTSTSSFNLTTVYTPTIDSIKTIITEVNNQTKIIATIHSDLKYYQEGIISMNINGKDYILTKSEGIYINKNDYVYNATLTFDFKDEGTYKYNITCNPINNYLKSTNTVECIIRDPKHLEIKLSSDIIIIGGSVTIKGILTNSKGGISNQKLKIFGDYPDHPNSKNLNHIIDLTTNSKGEVEHTLTFMEKGIYEYFLDSKYFKICVQSPTKVIANTITAQKNSMATLYVNIKDNLNEGYIQTTINGQKYKADVNNGNATINFKMPSKIGTYTYTVTYFPESQLYCSSSTNFKVISKIGTKITIKSVSGTQGKKVKLTATVKDEYGYKMKKGTVIFKVNGKTYKSSIKKGIASIKIKCPKAKYWDMKSKTSGNYLYETIFYKSIIKCDVHFNQIGDYLGSSSKFKITSKKNPVKHKYKINKYKTIIVPVKNGKSIINRGSVQVITKKFDSGTQNVLYVCAIKDNDFMTHYIKIHSKKNGKWHWTNWLKLNKRYDGQFEYGEYTYDYRIKADKIEVKYYDVSYTKIY